MDFGLSTEQCALRDSINRYLDEHAGVELLREVAAGADAAALWRGLVELGVPSLLVPESQGGVGLSILDAALVAECLGAHAAPAPFLASAVIAPLALQHADTEIRDTVLAKLVDGHASAGLAFSEVAAARDDAGVSANGTRLSGRALFVFDPQADYLFVATVDGQLFLLAADAEGLQARTLTTIDRTRSSGELVLAGARGVLLSADPEIVAGLLDVARVMLVADTLGAAQHMLDAAVAYAGQRKQFGRLIGSFQAVKHLCAEMAAELEPCRAMLWYAAHAVQALPAEARLTACHAKAHVAEVGTFVARTATEVHGGIGFTDLLGLHYWFKRIGFNRQALGGPELLREQAAALQGLTRPAP